jgi:hypothetical protein
MGSTVTDLDFQHDGLSESNVLTFYAALADGRQGIYVTSVPEPARWRRSVWASPPAASATIRSRLTESLR